MTICDSPPEPPELRKVESGPTFEVWRMRSSTLRLEWSRAGRVAVVRLTVVGHGHIEFAGPCIRRWEDALRTSERLRFLVDFWSMPTYDSPFRIGLTEWTAEHRGRLEPIHMLTRSPLVRMGAQVANLALGGLIKTYTLRTSFDLAVKELDGAPKPSRRR
jgi:hypothetical protein